MTVDVGLPTTAEGWRDTLCEAAVELRERDLSAMLGPEAAAALEEFLVADAFDSLDMIGRSVAEGRTPGEATAAMLMTHLRLGLVYGVWLAARKGVRVP